MATVDGTFCHKVDLFAGDVFSADNTDNDCTNPAFTKSINYSVFGSLLGDKATFTSGTEGDTATFSIREDDTITSAFGFNILTQTASTLTISLKFPTCASPSTIPSPIPSLIPNAVPI